MGMKLTFFNILLGAIIGLSASASAQNITTFAGTNTGFLGDGGAAGAAKMNLPLNSAKDAVGNLYIADANNNRIRIVAATTGVIQTMAGDGTPGHGGDGGAATAAQLQHPSDVKTDAAGNIYVCDAYNCCIRKINSGGTITTIAGTPGVAGYGGDGGAATSATLDTPAAIALDAAGNLYIADGGNNRVRMVNTSGMMSTIAGNGGAGLSGMAGAATAASIGAPGGVATDAAGNVYVSAPAEHRVLKVDAATGNIHVFAGNGTAGYGGEAGAATAAMLRTPHGICTDAIGNVYIADRDNLRVRKVNTLGNIYNVAGAGFMGCCTDGNPATVALMNNPMGVMVDDEGKIFIADAGNARIRRVDARANLTPELVYGPRRTTPSCENDVTYLEGFLSTYHALAGETLTWTEVTAPLHGLISGLPASATTTSLAMMPAGTVPYTPTPGYSGIDSFVLSVSDGTASDTITVVISLGPNPHPGSISGPMKVCVGETITLTNTVTSGAWYSPTPALATVSSAGVVTGVSEGTAVISYLVTNACATLATTYMIAVRPEAECASGIAQIAQQASVQVFPNPAEGSFTIALPQAALLPARVILTDLVGREVATWLMSTSRSLNATVDAPAGVYILTVSGSGGREATMLTIK